MDIVNNTPRPLIISLPGGKIMRLGPKMTGQITAKASLHPPVQKLIEEGVIAIVGDGGKTNTGGGASDGSGGGGSNQGGASGGGAMRRSGDR